MQDDAGGSCEIVGRMAELHMAADVSKNTADIENYSKEFLELQDQLNQEGQKFNGVELFAGAGMGSDAGK